MLVNKDCQTWLLTGWQLLIEDKRIWQKILVNWCEYQHHISKPQTMLPTNDSLAWLQIVWRLWCHSVKGYAWKSMLDIYIYIYMDFWNGIFMLWCSVCFWYVTMVKVFQGFAPSQWEVALQCDVISHWLNTYIEWFLRIMVLGKWSNLNWASIYTDTTLDSAAPVIQISVCRPNLPSVDRTSLFDNSINGRQCVCSGDKIHIPFYVFIFEPVTKYIDVIDNHWLWIYLNSINLSMYFRPFLFADDLNFAYNSFI